MTNGTLANYFSSNLFQFSQVCLMFKLWLIVQISKYPHEKERMITEDIIIKSTIKDFIITLILLKININIIIKKNQEILPSFRKIFL